MLKALRGTRPVASLEMLDELQTTFAYSLGVISVRRVVVTVWVKDSHGAALQHAHH
jgi:hypothetical protein